VGGSATLKQNLENFDSGRKNEGRKIKKRKNCPKVSLFGRKVLPKRKLEQNAVGKAGMDGKKNAPKEEARKPAKSKRKKNGKKYRHETATPWIQERRKVKKENITREMAKKKRGAGKNRAAKRRPKGGEEFPDLKKTTSEF